MYYTQRARGKEGKYIYIFHYQMKKKKKTRHKRRRRLSKKKKEKENYTKNRERKWSVTVKKKRERITANKIFCRTLRVKWMTMAQWGMNEASQRRDWIDLPFDPPFVSHSTQLFHRFASQRMCPTYCTSRAENSAIDITTS